MKLDRHVTMRTTSHPSRIGIFHLSLNPCGGAESLALTLIDALHECGHRVELITIEKTDWDKIKTILGVDLSSVDRTVVIPPWRTLPTMYSTFVYWLLRDAIFMPLMKGRYDLTITTMQTLPVIFSDVLYIHFPDFTSTYLDKHYRKYSEGVGRAYSLPFRLFSSLAIQAFMRMPHRPLLVTNSQYSRDQIRHDLNSDAVVVHPGIDTRRYAHRRNVDREDLVVTVSRIEEKKNLDILPRLARFFTKKTKFVLLGTTDRTSEGYVSHIISEAKNLGTQDRFLILRNASEAQKVELFSKAKLYLHTMRSEHFGMSIVEGMSAGLVPVVHKSGGPWVDILSRTQGLYGYAYERVEEAASIMRHLLEDEKTRAEISRRAVQRAALFDLNIFKSSISELVENLLTARAE